MLQVFENLGDLDGVANSLWAMAQINLQHEDYQGAFERLNKSYTILLKLGRLDGICYVGLNLGRLLCSAGQKKQGIAILNKSEEGFRHLGREDLAAQIRELITGFGSWD